MLLSAVAPSGIAAPLSNNVALMTAIRPATAVAQQNDQSLNLGATRFSNPSLADSYSAQNTKPAAQDPPKANFGLLCIPICGAVLALCCLPLMAAAVGITALTTVAVRAMGRGPASARMVDPD